MESACGNRDALLEILMRVNPHDIFNCILVSMDWLSVITASFFREKYLDRWKDSNSMIVGLLRCEFVKADKNRSEIKRWAGGKLLATSSLGRNINTRNLTPNMGDNDFIISKSTKGDLLLFGRRTSGLVELYVWNPRSDGEPVRLPKVKPSRRVYSGLFMANSMPSMTDDTGYSVILGGRSLADDRNLNVQIYLSSAGKWSEYQLSCQTSVQLCPENGIQGGSAAKRGDVFYWKATKNKLDCLVAVYAPGSGRHDFRVIPGPPFKNDRKHRKKYEVSIRYGVSPQGSLLAVVLSYPREFNDWRSKWFAVEIWDLDDDGGDKYDWSLLYNVSQGSMWSENLALLTSLSRVRPAQGGEFVFVSFVPGKSDSIYVALEEQLFVYDFCTGKLEYVEYLKFSGDHLVENFDGVTYHPLTMLDLGVWPSPPNLQLPAS